LADIVTETLQQPGISLVVDKNPMLLLIIPPPPLRLLLPNKSKTSLKKNTAALTTY
jgi:hypothetical protein